MASLYDLGFELTDLVAQYEAAGSPDEGDEIWQKIEATESAIDVKVDAYAKLLKNAEADIEAYSTEIKRLTAMKQGANKLIDRLKASMMATMEMLGKSKYNTSIGTWTLRLNPPRVEILDTDKVPEEYRVHQPDTINKSAILATWKQTGEIVDGSDVVQDKRVQFR